MQWLRAKSSDAFVAVFVMAITAMLLIPLPTALLDFLLVVNLAISLLVLLAGLYMANALAMLTFPTVLLLTTLFRLALNVASSRLILTQGEAGQVIEAFGRLLIQGEVAVGIVIFLLITIVNFIVIARGASRVSEVAARFALEALPGRQMAIDADLRAGLITAAQAQRARADLGKESQLYGSMDGAMRFVQGDAIAGFFIIVTNIVGGLYLGIARGESFAFALERYTILTVGDGLVSQIPALLISICAGIVVTRVSASEGTTLGTDISRQILLRPGLLGLVALMIVLLGVLTQLPTGPFVLTGIGLAGISLIVTFRASIFRPAIPVAQAGDLQALPIPEGSIEGAAAGDSTVTILLDKGVLFRLYQMGAQRYQHWCKDLSSDFAQRLGIPFPAVTVRAEALPALQYEVRIKGAVLDTGSVPLDCILVEMSPQQAFAFGLEVDREDQHPLDGSTVFWTPQSPDVRRIVEAFEVRSLEFFHVIVLRAAAALQRMPEELLSISTMFSRIQELEKQAPGFLQEIFSGQVVSVPRITQIGRELVREGLFTGDTRHFIELLATYCTEEGASLTLGQEFDIEACTNFLRHRLRRQLTARELTPRHSLKAVLVTPEVESYLQSLGDPLAEAPAILPSELHALRAGLEQVVSPVLQRGVYRPCLVVRRELRHKLRQLLRFFDLSLAVLAIEELEPALVIEPVGFWQLAES